MRRLGADASSMRTITWVRMASQIRGTAAMIVGFTTARFSMIFGIRPSTAVTEPDAMCADISTLPNE